MKYDRLFKVEYKCQCLIIGGYRFIGELYNDNHHWWNETWRFSNFTDLYDPDDLKLVVNALTEKQFAKLVEEICGYAVRNHVTDVTDVFLRCVGKLSK